MAVTVDDLRELVNSGPSDDAVLDRCLAFGRSVVDSVTALATQEIPEGVLDEAILTAASDHFQRRKAPNGVLNQVFDAGDGVVPIRIGGNPADSVRTLLAAWLPVRNGLTVASLAGEA